MAMLRSLQSGVSGLKGFQTELDVIGNNISNVNTTGFKKNRITFADAMNQTLEGANASQNAEQIGLGSKINAVDTINTTGTPDKTGEPLDLAINGSGYFILGSGLNSSPIPHLFTRNGHFHISSDGYLVNDKGLYVLGRIRDSVTGEILPPVNGTYTVVNMKIPKEADLQGANSGKKLDVSSLSISGDGIIHYMLVGDPNAYETGPIALAQFNNPEGLEKIGDSVFKDSAGSSGGQYDQNTDKKIISGALEASNVDLTEEMTQMIEAERAYQSNAKVITTSDQILNELVQLKR